MPTHVMVDIETIGRPPDGGIIAIGAVKFNPSHSPENADFSDVFEILIDPHDAVRTGGTIDLGTVMWWSQQDPAVRSRMFSGQIGVRKALRLFTEWYGPADAVWANGTTFDIVLLDAAFKRINMKSPWHYRDVRDMRMFRDITDNDYIKKITELYEANTKAHDALADAITQAKSVVEANKVLQIYRG